jgi:hypothetical protein
MVDEQVRFASGLNLCLALWLILSPFILGFAGFAPLAMANAILVGLIVLVLAWMRLRRPAGRAWASWVNAVLGAWLCVSSYVLGTSYNAASYWNSISVGIPIILFAVWSGLEARASA